MLALHAFFTWFNWRLADRCPVGSFGYYFNIFASALNAAFVAWKLTQ